MQNHQCDVCTMNSKNIKVFIFKLFFIVISFIYFIKLENEIYPHYDYCYFPHLTNIEIVVNSHPPYNLQSYKNPHLLKLKNSEHRSFDFDKLKINRTTYTLQTRFSIHSLLNFQLRYSPNRQILSILQKKNIWHQSSDDDPFYSNHCRS